MGFEKTPKNRNMLQLWKLFAVILTIQSFFLYSTSNAKQLNAHPSFDDTFDIDQFDEFNSETTNIDSNTLFEDELQLAKEDNLIVDTNNDSNNGFEDDASGWFTKGVRRVRRELGRLFGGSDDEIKHAKHHKKSNLQHPKKNDKTLKKERQAPLKKHNAAIKASRHRKRADDEDYEHVEGSANGPGTDEQEQMRTYEAYFIVHEPWNEGFRNGRNDIHFRELSSELESSLREIFLAIFPDDSDFISEVIITLEFVEQTQDLFKVYVMVTLYLPENSDSVYHNLLYSHITNYHRIGSIGADVDDKFYVRQKRDSSVYEGREQGGESVNKDENETRNEVERVDENEGEVHRENYGENNGSSDGAGANGSEGYGANGSNGYGANGSNGYGANGSEGYDAGGDADHTAESGNSYNETNVEENSVDPCDDNPNGWFTCRSGGQYVECHKRCNNFIDCDDESDEDETMCRRVLGHDENTDSESEATPSPYPTEEHSSPMSPPTGQVIDNCDNNPEGDFICGSGEKIPCYVRCDSQPDCRDGSDEADEKCHRDNNSSTNDSSAGNNGNEEDHHEHHTTSDDVEASGDDNDFDAEATTETSAVFESGCRGDTYFTCPLSGYNICDDQRCDDHEDCPDGEDENDCSNNTNEPYPDGDNDDNDDDDDDSYNYEKVCLETEFKCDDRCVPSSFRCNGVVECIDRTDEENCPNMTPKECQPHEYKCRSGDCIDARQRCDRVVDCPDGDDEDDRCQVTHHTPDDCTRDEFFCDDDCHSNSLLCNGFTDCTDGRDESNCPPQTQFPTRRPPQSYPCPQHTCPNGKCYSENERCDNTPDCDDGSDEMNCHSCAADEFRCHDGGCIKERAYCDGIVHCRDGSDEEACSDPGRSCLTSQFRCDNGQCINQAARCDGRTDCIDSSDEANCSGHQMGPAAQLNLKTYPPSQIIKESREVIFRCRDEGPLRARVRWIRPGGRPLPPGVTDKNGRLEIPNIRMEDAGQYVCEAVGYPRHVPGQQVTVHLTVERYNPMHDRGPTACHINQATCMNGECIDKSQICDGVPHCSDGSDEHSCSHGRRCHPNQFMCRNSKCVDRIWRCDGENDCGDNSDEDSCDPEPSGAPCRYDEFQCKTGHCVPKSFQCDDTNDCLDGSDEIGCVAPTPIRQLPPSKHLREGEALNLTCVGTGVPIPVIVWRLNWGHVPDKCISKSHAGTGTLYCPNMQTPDSGAYSCEIINSIGTEFVRPDTIVHVGAPTNVDVCPAGFFNMLARRREDCISCFCFGVSKNCKSANLFNFALQPPITSHRVVNVELTPYGNPTINEAPSSTVLTLHHGVQFRASDVQYASREAPYLALPDEYLGNQLKSYGGSLRYDVNYMGNGRPTQSPDVIITGNGNTLVHRAPSALQPNVNNKMLVKFLPGNWNKPDGRSATREEIMMVLAGTTNILIRLGYIDTTEREVELTNIIMDSAGLQDQGLGAASLVEQCQCPVGYTGDSCENCAPGFERQPGGPWLGRCVPFLLEPCGPGTYGDPRRGIPCRECPCPQTGANNFASGCQMGPDGDVICNCHEGYAGRRCEICAPGYQGNPLIAGGSCHRVPEHSCNSEGTYYTRPDGTCECKPLVVGPRCDMCAPDSFNLNSYTYTGCTECFCSGLTKQCSSSSWYRDQISSNFGRSRAPHGFNLIRDYETSEPAPVSFQLSDSALQFSQHSNSEPLYWSLPPQFLGDQITAYGGKLNYTLSYNPLPGGLMSRNNAPDVVIKSGEDLTIIHYRKAGVNPSQSSSYSVPIIESAWQRSDGQLVNREHLLMALSKIEAVYIKATYTTGTKEGSLQHVSMDIATQNNIGTQRAVEVEECRCPIGYNGLSCERCAPGYKRDTEAGLYLGICEPCECNGHSSQCDAETGVCLNCAHNTEGDNCERCIEGYVGNPTAGTQYDCMPDNGREPYPPPQPDNQEQCRSCNSAGTSSCDNGQCYCKENVIGVRCDQCRPGTYGLHSNNPDGCSECYCSGKVTQCHSASLYRQLIPVDFIDTPPLITDEEGNVVDQENLNLNLSTNQYTYNHQSYTQKYWSLRGSVLGNQLHSYGGDLSYNLQVESYGEYVPGHDVILIGNGLKLAWSRPRDSDQKSPDYNIRLHEDGNWQRIEGGRASEAARLDFMRVLSNLEHIILRATPFIPTMRTSLRDVILETAVERPMPGARQAVEVELCACPAEYTGNSCENCAPLHYRNSFDTCVPCPCQEDTTSSCAVDSSGYVECRCKPGHSGDRCQHYDESGTTMETTTPPSYDYRTQIRVSIAPLEISIVPAGGSITLSCTGQLVWNGSPVYVKWYKLGGELPYESEENAGELRLYNLQIYDSGTYICQAVSNQTQHVFKDQVSITVAEGDRREPAKIVDLPQYHTFEEFQPNEIICLVSGNPAPRVIWTRVDGQMSHEVRTENNRLIFDSPRRSDQGHYRCQASNPLGSDEKYTEITVNVVPVPQPQPQPHDVVYIEPPQFTGGRGETVRLTCHQTAPGTLSFKWLKDGYPIPAQPTFTIRGNTLEMMDVRRPDSGLYTCIAVDQRGRQNYTSDALVTIIEENYPQPFPDPRPLPGTVPPTVKRLPEENRIVQGHDFSITCEATGTPYPNIKWTKVHESLADNVHPQGNVLRIINARPENRGMYLCIAENGAGSDQSHTVVDVEPRERPTVDIHPPEPQTVYVGSEARLYCSGNGIPEPRLQWRRVNGNPMPIGAKEETPGYITISNILLEDAGDYECVAENDIGKATAVATIRVIEAPVITLVPGEEILRLTEGDDLKIICSASGYPNPSVMWENHEQPETNIRQLASTPEYNMAHLEIYRLSRADAKTYKCIATNEAGSDERYVTVDVQPRRGDAPDDSDVDRQPYQPSQQPSYRPDSQVYRPGQQPPYNPDPHIYQANTGDDVNLKCDLVSPDTGEPIPYLQTRWERVDGHPLPSNSYFDRNTLVITRVEKENSGQYRCNGIDNRGQLVTFVIAELVLLPIPRITFHPKIPLVVTENDDIDILCEVSGEQPIDVAWHTGNNRPLPPSVRIDGPYLRFVSITPADAGDYFCYASNRFGSTKSKASVIVNSGNSFQPQPYQNRHEASEGGDVTLTCVIDNQREPIRGELRYNWTRADGRPLPSNAYIRNEVLLIRGVHKSDEGRYVCDSYTTAGNRSPPSYVDLIIKRGHIINEYPCMVFYICTVGVPVVRPPVYLPPTTRVPQTTPPPVRDFSLNLNQQHSNLRVGESTEVECYSSDNMYTDVVWERANGDPLPPHIQQIGNRLIINHVTAADAGNYVCKCKTDEGDLYTTSYELEIESSEHEWKPPKVVYAKAGSEAKLQCNSDSERTVGHRWSRQYGQMQPGRELLNEHLILLDVQSNDSGTYICTVNTPDGEFIDYPTILVVTGAIPHFHQDSNSYLSFPTLPDSNFKLNFDLSFRPEQPNGLLLFNGQKRGSGDYISLSLQERYLEFRFNFDGKHMVIRSEKPVSLNEWHTVRVNRFRRDGYMQVDEQHPVAFPTLAQVSPLDLVEDLYIGGVPNWDILPEDAIDQRVGFVGCISRLTLQGRNVELMKEAKFKEGIDACEPCKDNPCENGGICLESQTETAYTCICAQGWTGHNCGIKGTQCTPGVCGTGRCENTDLGMECLCPLNRTGDRCQYTEHLNENSLAFKTNSYAAYGTPRASKLNIKLLVRPNSLEDSVLLYAAESKLPSGDYFAVVLRNKHIELLTNTGARLKPIVVRSQNPLELNKWTEIDVSRRFGEGILRVGQEPEQKAKAGGLARMLYIKTPLYVGGYDTETVQLNRDINITRGFDGCISKLYEAQRQINLLTDIEDAANILNCGELNEIDHKEASDNYEQPHQPTTVDHLMDACSSDPCENGGTCSLNSDKQAICDCPIRFAGKHCEEHITLEMGAKFSGNGYLELNRTQFDENVNQKYSFAALVFSTTDPNGLLLWWGQPKGVKFDGQDFMALGLVDGIVEFSFRLNGEETLIRNPDKRVDDGRRHVVLIKRTDNTAMLELDHLLDAGETRPTGIDTMSLPGHVFIGGAPDLASFTGNRYQKNFNGCIHVVEGESSGTIPLGQVAVSGMNVDTCPQDDPFGGTEPPVV